MNFLEYEKNHNKFLLALNENKNAQFSSILDTILSHDNCTVLVPLDQSLMDRELTVPFVESHVVYRNPDDLTMFVSLNQIRGKFNDSYTHMRIISGPPKYKRLYHRGVKDPYSVFQKKNFGVLDGSKYVEPNETSTSTFFVLRHNATFPLVYNYNNKTVHNIPIILISEPIIFSEILEGGGYVPSSKLMNSQTNSSTILNSVDNGSNSSNSFLSSRLFSSASMPNFESFTNRFKVFGMSSGESSSLSSSVNDKSSVGSAPPIEQHMTLNEFLTRQDQSIVGDVGGGGVGEHLTNMTTSTGGNTSVDEKVQNRLNQLLSLHEKSLSITGDVDFENSRNDDDDEKSEHSNRNFAVSRSGGAMDESSLDVLSSSPSSSRKSRLFSSGDEQQEEKKRSLSSSFLSLSFLGGSTTTTTISTTTTDNGTNESSDTSSSSSSHRQTTETTVKSKKFNFADFVSKMRHHSAVNLVKNIKRFINELNRAEYVPENTDNPQYSFSNRVQSFLSDVMREIQSHPQWRNASELEMDNAREGIEKYVMTKLYNKVFSPTIEDLTLDHEVAKRLSLFNKRLLPRHLDLDPNLVNDNMSTAEDQQICAQVLLAISELKKINTYKTPRDKMICISNSCKIIFNILSQYYPKEQASADTFLPVLIYLVMKANPPHLHSNLKYIMEYRNPDKLLSEGGYFLTNLQSSVMFWRHVDQSSLTISKEEYDELFAKEMARSQIFFADSDSDEDDRRNERDKRTDKTTKKTKKSSEDDEGGHLHVETLSSTSLPTSEEPLASGDLFLSWPSSANVTPASPVELEVKRQDMEDVSQDVIATPSKNSFQAFPYTPLTTRSAQAQEDIFRVKDALTPLTNDTTTVPTPALIVIDDDMQNTTLASSSEPETAVTPPSLSLVDDRALPQTSSLIVLSEPEMSDTEKVNQIRQLLSEFDFSEARSYRDNLKEHGGTPPMNDLLSRYDQMYSILCRVQSTVNPNTT